MTTLNDMKFKSIMAKRKSPYEGNEKFDDELDKETANGGNFAKGGMVKCTSCGGKMAEGGMSCAQGCKMADGGMSYGGMMRDGGMMNDGGKMMKDGGSVDKKKSAVMAIIAKIGKKPMDSVGKSPDKMESEGEGMEGGDMMGEAKMSAASEVMDALKGGDVAAFSSALENFMQACRGYED